MRPETVTALLDAGHVPVIAGVARGAGGSDDQETVYNVNADTAAAALALAIDAEKLVILTDVEGLVRQLARHRRGDQRGDTPTSWRR